MNNTLVIGTGGCGNKFLNTFMELLSERDDIHAIYDGIFVNSNKNEMEILEYCDLKKNALTINGDGTGRNRDKAKESIAEDRVNVMNFFSGRIDKYQSAIIMTSCDGGFGSGSIVLLTKVLKQLNPDIKTFLLGASAKLKSKRMSLENTLSLYEDIKMLLKQNMLDSYLFVDNDKMKDEEEFNQTVMTLFLDSLELGVEALDSNDSLLVNFSKGYKLILPLSNKEKTVSDAVDEAINNSPFVIPNRNKATHIYGTFNPDDFTEEDILTQYTITDFDKLVVAEDNFIVLNGFGNPDKHMSTVNAALEMLELEDEEDDNEEEFTFTKKKSKIDKEIAPKNKKQRLRSMMKGDFWS